MSASQASWPQSVFRTPTHPPEGLGVSPRNHRPELSRPRPQLPPTCGFAQLLRLALERGRRRSWVPRSELTAPPAFCAQDLGTSERAGLTCRGLRRLRNAGLGCGSGAAASEAAAQGPALRSARETAHHAVFLRMWPRARVPAVREGRGLPELAEGGGSGAGFLISIGRGLHVGLGAGLDDGRGSWLK